MKASEACKLMIAELGDVKLTDWGHMKSRVDETKTLIEMFNMWVNLFENNPDLIVRSIMKYNVNRDFRCL